jgi:hypothetical protein
MLGGGSWVAARQGQGYTGSSTSDGAAALSPVLFSRLDVLPPVFCSSSITACRMCSIDTMGHQTAYRRCACWDVGHGWQHVKGRATQGSSTSDGAAAALCRLLVSGVFLDVLPPASCSCTILPTPPRLGRKGERHSQGSGGRVSCYVETMQRTIHQLTLYHVWTRAALI